MKTIREYAAGQFPVGQVWYEAEFVPERLTEPVNAAKALRCSADYLLGLTDELRPGAFGGWMSGDTLPESPGECVAVFDMGDGGAYYRTTCYWSGSSFCFGKGGAPIREKLVRWLQLPPEPETGPEEDPCDICKSAHPYCDSCCAACEDRCNGAQRCSRKEDCHADA